MDWLKTLLEEATITDGKLDIDGLMKSIQSEFPKHAVPKEQFNAKNEELKTANATIETLKKNNADNDALQKQIDDYKGQISKLQADQVTQTKAYALKEALEKEGVLDADYLIYKAGGVDKFTFDKDNKPIGVKDALKPFKDDKTMAHLFKVEGGGYEPVHGGTGGVKNPFAKDTFNLTEQGELLKSNPEQARALAAAAGVKI